MIARPPLTSFLRRLPRNHLRRSVSSSNRQFGPYDRVSGILPRQNISEYVAQNYRDVGYRCSSCSFRTFASISPRNLADLEDYLHSSVSAKVKDPEADTDLKALGWLKRKIAISEDGTVQMLLQVPTLLHPSLDDIKSSLKIAAEEEIRKFSSEKGLELGEAKVNVSAIASKPLPWMVKDDNDQKEIESRLGPGLVNVSHFLTVYSCKGGVGKSTIAVNLAYELARMGGRIGLLDVDVHGPSLPVLVQPDDPAVRQSPLGTGMVYPIEHKGVKMLSLGFVSPTSGVPGSGGGGATVLRGPMAGKVVTQLLKGTDWGELDVLILDLPPGTGDVQLTLCQDLDISGAVCVTTPSKLATADARKGIEMFSALGVPTLALVENMSFFECEGGGKHYPFGKGFSAFLEDSTMKDINIENVCQFPISSNTNDANDSGVPLCLSRPESATAELDAFTKLAQMVSKELYRLPLRSEHTQGQISFEDSTELFDLLTLQLSVDSDCLVVRVFSENGAIQKRISAESLRGRDPKTGDFLEKEKEDTTPETDSMVTVVRASQAKAPKSKILPERVEKKAKVGYEVVWSDGAKFIYSRQAIAMAAGAKLLKQTRS